MRHPSPILASLLAVLVLSLCVACGGADLGASPTTPLGRLAKIEGRLAARGLTKHAIEADEVKPFLPPDLAAAEDVEITEYRGAVAGYKHAVLLLKRGGELICVVGVFRSGSFVFSKVGTSVETFIASYWSDLSGADAEFVKKNDASLGQREYLSAEFNKGGAKGYWRKDSQDETMRTPQGVIDKVWIRKP